MLYCLMLLIVELVLLRKLSIQAVYSSQIYLYPKILAMVGTD